MWRFILGVGSGLVVALLLWLCKWGFARLINMFAEDVLPQEWSSQYAEEDEEYTESISIRQAGRSIKGTATLTLSDGSTEVQEIRGTYKNQILTAQYWSSQRGAVERGTFTLRKLGRDRLEGHYIFFSGTPLKLRSSQYVWTRVKK